MHDYTAFCEYGLATAKAYTCVRQRRTGAGRAVRGGFEVGNRIYVKMEVSSTPKLWAFDLNAGGSNCQIDVIEEDNIVKLFWSVDDQCTAKHKLGRSEEHTSALQ